MKRLLTLVPALLLFLSTGRILAADAAAKPDCSAKQKAYDEAKTAAKPIKADLSACKDKKGGEKADCEKPIKDKAKEDHKAATEKMKADKKDLDCCKNPKMTGCAG